MRIGMAHLFDGRQQKSLQFFELANKYRDGLPPKERSLLDIYSDLWLNQEFDAAFVKLRAYVDSYPGDAEGRAFYGLASWVFNKDTTVIRAQYDTVLASEPTNQLVLGWYGDFMQQVDNPDSAIYYYRKVRSYHPESPSGYLDLAGAYREQGKHKKAAEEYLLVTELFPDEAGAWTNLVGIAIEQRQFDRAEQYLNRYRESVGDDPYRLNTYYSHRANLANWKGQFRDAIDYTHKGLQQTMLTGDSTLVRGKYSTLYSLYYYFGKPDSALWAADRLMDWASGFNRIDGVLKYAEISPEKCDSVRPMFEEIVTDFRTRMPPGIWPLIDNLEKVYDAQCELDSARLASALLGLADAQQPGQGTGNRRAAAIIQVKIGRYREGLEGLKPYLTGEEQITSGFTYPLILYYTGVAEQELGDRNAAVDHLQEMLHYWGNADIQFDELKDARRRLAQLTS
jgi:tetratricopeptide (TPR) repeat protein